MRHPHFYHHLANEINDHCSGMIITECFSQEKHCVILRCETQGGGAIAHIEWSMLPGEPMVYLKEGIQRANRNSADVFPDIIGRVIVSCTKHPTDRIVFLHMTGAMMVGHFFGGSNTSLFLLDDQQRLIDYLKRAPLHIDETYIPMLSEVKGLKENPKHSTLIQALSKAQYCGEIYAREIIARWNDDNTILHEDMLLDELKESACEGVQEMLDQVLEESLNSNTAYILRLTSGSVVLSSIHLHEEQEMIWSGQSWSEAIRRYRGLMIKDSRLTALKKEAEYLLRHRREILEKHIHHLSDRTTSQQRIEESQQIAQLLLSMPYPSLRVQEEQLTLTNGDLSFNIQLQKGKTYAEHAEYYFNKAKRSRERDEEKRSLLPVYKEQLHEIVHLQIALPEMTDSKKIVELIAKLKGRRRSNSEEKIPQSPYREFVLSSTFTLYVGRNAQNNDQLTGKFAKPNDLWLHARGVSGSHAILRGPKEIPKNILEEAAAITAYFSQSRKGSFVPVSYALKKYIRKPKGAGPGAVVMEREEVILVEPRLPKGSKES